MAGQKWKIRSNECTMGCKSNHTIPNNTHVGSIQQARVALLQVCMHSYVFPWWGEFNVSPSKAKKIKITFVCAVLGHEIGRVQKQFDKGILICIWLVFIAANFFFWSVEYLSLLSRGTGCRTFFRLRSIRIFMNNFPSQNSNHMPLLWFPKRNAQVHYADRSTRCKVCRFDQE